VTEESNEEKKPTSLGIEKYNQNPKFRLKISYLDRIFQ
jgi:hypothetical protein